MSIVSTLHTLVADVTGAAGEAPDGAVDHAAHHGDGLAHAVHTTIGLLGIAVAIGVLTRFVRLPYTIALVLAGLAIALTDAVPTGAVMTHDLVLLVFLPPLLFQAGLHLDLEHLRRVWLPVLIMALPGVVVSTFLVGTTFHLLATPDLHAMITPLSSALGEDTALWVVALLVGVVLSPTDPISVMATFKTTGAPEELKTMVEGESLFNDGTAVAIFALLATIVGGALTGASGSEASESLEFSAFALNFVRVAGLGTVIGLILGSLAFLLIRILEDHTLETGLTVALAWGSFLIAEHFHASGVIAVVVAALIMGNYGRVLHMSESTQDTVHGFWDTLDFIVNSILFLMIGFELSDPAVGGREAIMDVHVWLVALGALAALLVSRALLTYPVVLLFKRHWPKGWKHVIWWSGLKGSLTLALLLMLPAGELRAYLLPIAFVVVLVSLLGQGASMPLVMRLTGVRGESTTDSTH